MGKLCAYQPVQADFLFGGFDCQMAVNFRRDAHHELSTEFAG